MTGRQSRIAAAKVKSPSKPAPAAATNHQDAARSITEIGGKREGSQDPHDAPGNQEPGKNAQARGM